jgi:tRNA_anti-like
MKKLLLVILVVAIAGGLYAYYQYNRKPAGVADQEAVKINAAALVASFMNDEKAAQATYNNKVLEVVGVVADHKTTILLQSDDPLSSVFCTLENKLTTLPKVGDEIIVKGFYAAYTTDVLLTGCIIK